MKRIRKTLAVIIVLALAIIPAGCTSREASGDGGGSGFTDPKAAATSQQSETAKNAVTTQVKDITQAPATSATDNAAAKSPLKIETELKPIKDVYKDDFLIGTAVSMENMTGIRYELLKMHFNAAAAENDMKPSALQPAKGKFDFSEADILVDKVLASGMQMYGHTLVCDQHTPAWMNTDAKGNPLGREEALDNMKAHIKTVIEHFGNKVMSWDVVNDSMSVHPTHPQDWKKSLRPAPWLAAIGDDYVEQAFLSAREALDAHPDWDIKLYYNDCGMDNQNKALAVYNMVKEINDNYRKTHPGKLLIDGIGMESHYNLDTDPVKVDKSLERFKSLGVEISISELDIQATSNGCYIWESGNSQAIRYSDLFFVFKSHAKDIRRISFWGTDDNTSWMNASSVMLFNESLQARPAYYGVTEQLWGFYQ